MRAKALENKTWYESDHSDENYIVCNSINEGNSDGVTLDNLLGISAYWQPEFESLLEKEDHFLL